MQDDTEALLEKQKEALAKSLADPSVTVNDDGTVTVELDRPIVLKDREITKVVVKAEATLDDMEAADKGKNDTARVKSMIVALTDLGGPHAGQLRTDDLTKIAPILGELMGKGRLTGGTS